jgi:K+-sensing histidine kinase KdpD
MLAAVPPEEGDAHHRRAASGPPSAGPGLAVVEATAWAHGGHVLVENRPAGGARVTVVFRAA